MKAILVMVFIFLFFYLIVEMCRYETAPVVGQSADLEYDFHQRLIILDRLMTLRDEDLLRLRSDIIGLNKALLVGAPDPLIRQPQSGNSAVALTVSQKVSATQVLTDIKKDHKRLRQNGTRPGDLKMARHRVILIITLLFLINVLLVLL